MTTLMLGRDNPSLSTLIEMAAKGIVIVQRGNKPAFAFMPVDEEGPRTGQLGENPDFLEIMRRSWARLQTEGGISLTEARHRLLTEQ